MELLGGDDARTGTHHQARRCNGLRISGGTGLADILIEQILKHCPVALKRNGVDVCEVVGNDRHASLLRSQTCFCYPN